MHCGKSNKGLCICPVSFGLAWGIVCAFSLAGLAWSAWFFGTGTVIVNHMGSFYYGYSANIVGILWGFFWGFIKGFLLGFFVALFYDFIINCCAKCCNKGEGNCRCCNKPNGSCSCQCCPPAGKPGPSA